MATEIMWSLKHFVGPFCWVDARGARHVQGVLCLGQSLVPQLRWEVFGRGAEARDKMVLERLDGAFSGVDVMFVRWNKMPFDVIVAEVLGCGGGCFIVEYVKFWLVPL